MVSLSPRCWPASLVLMSCLRLAHAETPVTPSSAQPAAAPTVLDPIVVTATRSEKSPFAAPNTVNVLTEDQLRQQQMTRTVPDSLKETPGVMVQRTSYGQGSPIIRGFTGFRTLFLIDGIRLNNSVFRDGPNQYWSTVDPLTIERLEVVKGPSSVLYGSDAVGGTVNAITRSRQDYGDGFQWDRRVTYRYATAEDSHTGRAELSGNLNRTFGLLAGGSIRDFDDLRGGHGLGQQPNTGYSEWDADIRLDMALSDQHAFTLAHQSVRQKDVPRTHSTLFGESYAGTTVGTERERDLDQNRHLTYVRYQGSDFDWFVQSAAATVSWHVQDEEQSRTRADWRSDRQWSDVDTIGFSVQLDSPSPAGQWTYGVEYYHDIVDSGREDFNADGSLRGIRIQGPVADDATYDLLGAYVQDEIPFFDERLHLTGGVRLNYAAADADKVEDPESGERISVSDQWTSVVGSIRAIVQLDDDDHWHAFGGVSQGFRAPNLSDLTRLDTARTNEIETPSPDLDPETFITYEAGIKTRYDVLRGAVTYFYTDIQDLITRTPTGNVIEGANEVTKKNGGDGYVHGVEADLSWRIHPQLTASGSFFWMAGYVDTFPTSDPIRVTEPLDRLQPMTGILSLRWDVRKDKAWLEFVTTLAERQDRLSTRDKADTERIPPEGTPGYVVFTLRGCWRVTDRLSISASVENLSDQDYRIHGSGVNEPGRNAVFGLDWRF